MEATGSILNNKYSEGYPGRRYYEGQDYIDQSGDARDRARKEAVRRGARQRAAVLRVACEPGRVSRARETRRKVMGLGLPFGGHLTHGWGVNFSGIIYTPSQYDVDPETHRVDLNRVESLARATRPKVIFCGGTAYPRTWDYAGFARDRRSRRRDARRRHRAHRGAHRRRRAPASVSAREDHHHHHAQDVARAARRHDLVRRRAREGARPRGVPGPAGRPAQSHDGRDRGGAEGSCDGRLPRVRRSRSSRTRRRWLRRSLERGFRLISGGTDNHLILIDVTPRGITGKPAAKALHEAGIECNYNTIPFDPRKPFDPSGLRIGTPSITSRGMREKRHGGDRGVDRPRAQRSPTTSARCTRSAPRSPSSARRSRRPASAI